MRVVLASRSPQRRAILEQLGIPFVVRANAVEELTAGPPIEVAMENAHRKAAAAARGAGEIVLGVDTLVVLGARMFGKPADEAAARATLEQLSGRRHEVIGGLCVITADGSVRTVHARTVVRFRTLDAALLDRYVASGEWRGRAGGYAIQRRGAALVTAIEGDYLNVVGLPVAALLELVPELLG